MSATAFDHRIGSVRRFNRFYTQKIGVLDEGLLQTPFSLAEARVLYELAHRDRPTAGELARELHLDPGYLSRMLRGFRRQGLIDRARAATDGRRSHLYLTTAGQAAFAPLDARSRDTVGAILGGLSDSAQAKLVAAMKTVERLLAPVEEPALIVVRPHRSGDIGWIIHRQAVLYTEEYGWDASFEGMVAGVLAGFIATFDGRRERCWIAEKDGEPVGSAALVNESDGIARLRVLLVEPRARGLGIGSRLVGECIRFARQSSYHKITLSTYSVLVAARRIYEASGFHLVGQAQEHSFGRDLIAETWEMPL